MRHGLKRHARRLAPGALLLLAACTGDYPQIMTRPVTEWGQIQIDIWALVTWWTVPILMVVFGLLAYIMVRFRDKPGRAEPKHVYGSTKLEIIWTVIPALIVLFIAIPTVQAIFALAEEAPEDALVVDVIGHQWWWEFRYPEEEIITANQFYVPIGRPVALNLRSADVIHSFWVPRLGGKRDVNPVVRTPDGVNPPHLNQIVVTVDSAGEYLGQCAEFCGTSHAIMRMMAVALEPEEFDGWADAMRESAEPVGDLAAEGHDIFMRSTCIACHAIEGTRAQGRLGPDLTLMGERFSIGAGLMANTPENMTEWILRAPELKKGVKMPGAQVEGGGMPPTALTREQAEAVAAYLDELRLPALPALRDPDPTHTPDALPPAEAELEDAPATTAPATPDS